MHNSFAYQPFFVAPKLKCYYFYASLSLLTWLILNSWLIPELVRSHVVSPSITPIRLSSLFAHEHLPRKSVIKHANELTQRGKPGFKCTIVHLPSDHNYINFKIFIIYSDKKYTTRMLPLGYG